MVCRGRYKRHWCILKRLIMKRRSIMKGLERNLRICIFNILMPGIMFLTGTFWEMRLWLRVMKKILIVSMIVLRLGL